ncbi:peptidoglycan-binding protein [Streptomyces sp. AGS-58]|uniref:peptidoglycan-binding domain-containing protein n=1 Tax=unclassified Streptomyces TaxID=2593676 RepID=UPI0035A2E460
MVLRCPRFSVDPELRDTQAGNHRMLEPEDGLAVRRVQFALLALGRDVGLAGDDGIFGPDTGAAVTAYKDSKGLTPDDPVVGPGTIQALDDDLFFDPPQLDPDYKEFAPSVADGRVEPFAGLELAALIDTPLNQWRRMFGFFTLNNLNSGQLLAITAESCAQDQRARFLDVAAPTQADGSSAASVFDGVLPMRSTAGRTVEYDASDGTRQAYLLLNDQVLLGRETILRRSTGTRAPVTTQGVLIHELTHVRNRAAVVNLLQTPDTDTDSYVDTVLAQNSSAAVSPTAEVLRTFVGEVCARHVHWIMLQETAGNPTAPGFLTPERLVDAVRFYAEDTELFDANGYLPGIRAQGPAALFGQLGLWLRRCQEFAFSDDASENARTVKLFGDAANVCTRLAGNPPTGTPNPDGLFPLPADFV